MATDISSREYIISAGPFGDSSSSSFFMSIEFDILLGVLKAKEFEVILAISFGEIPFLSGDERIERMAIYFSINCSSKCAGSRRVLILPINSHEFSHICNHRFDWFRHVNIF